MAVRLRKTLPKPDYEIEDVVFDEPYSLEEMLEAIENNKNLSAELTPPGRLLFLGLVRLDYCDEHRLMKSDEIACQMRKLLKDYEVNTFNYKMWFAQVSGYLELEPYVTTFCKTKKTDTAQALEAAQEIINILYNINEKL